MTSVLFLNQTLHGYLDGHQLLASSLDLSRDQQSLLLVMSDLSGPSFRDGYESYLTGYPLLRAGMYCVARTWFAPEMPRPGCVWTHTLIIRDEDVARIVDFRALNNIFRRPSEENRFSSYQDQVVFEGGDVGLESNWGNLRSVLVALYDSPQKIVIPSESPRPVEDFVLAIINQQWPRLRRNFRFCTGSLSIRETEFDVSISPPEVTHSIGDTGLIINRDEPDLGPCESWAEFAYDDLVSATQNSPLRKFLWQFGPDHSDGRQAFRPLTETYLLIRSPFPSAAPHSVLSAVAHYFPKPQEAHRLKAELFGRSGKYNEELGGELATLRLLISHPAATSVSDTIANVKDRAGELADHDLDAAMDIALLAAEIGSDNSQKFLDGFSNRGNWSPQALEKAPLSVLSLVLDHKPKLIGSPGVWARSDYMSILAKVITPIEADAELLSIAIRAMVDAEAWNAVAWILDRIGTDAAVQIFGNFEHDQSDVLDVPDAAYAMLGSRISVWGSLLGTDAIGPRSLKLLSAVLDSRSQYIGKVSYSRLLAAANLNIKFADKDRSLRSAVFFLSLGFRSWEETGAVLVASSFSKVYDAAKKNTLSVALWNQLEPNLSWYSPSWDHCAQLVRTAARGFKERSWPVEYFLVMFTSDDQMIKAVEEIDQMWGGSRVLKRLRDALRSSRLNGSQEQLNLLEKLL